MVKDPIISNTDQSEDAPSVRAASPERRTRRLGKSRDGWKYKVKEKQKQIKVLKVKTHDLGVSRDDWKSRAKRAEAALKAHEEKLTELPPDDLDVQKK